jgi:hypothetical protein
MTKKMTIAMMMTSMIQRMAKKSWLVPNLLMLLKIHKLRCVSLPTCSYTVHHQLGHMQHQLAHIQFQRSCYVCGLVVSGI